MTFNEYKHLLLDIRYLEDKVDKLESSLLSSPPPDGQPKPVGYKADKLANTVAKIADLDKLLQGKLLKLDITHKQLNLENWEKELLRMKFYSNLSFRQIGTIYSLSHIVLFRKHKKIISKFNNIP